jgi:hypothetical protein
MNPKDMEAQFKRLRAGAAEYAQCVISREFDRSGQALSAIDGTFGSNLADRRWNGFACELSIERAILLLGLDWHSSAN